MLLIGGLFLLMISVFVEALILSGQKYWKDKKALVLMAALFLVLSDLLLLSYKSVWLIFVVIISVYKLVNLARLYKNRLPEKHLKSVSLRSFVVLTLLQASLLIFWQLADLVWGNGIEPVFFINIFIVASLLSSIIVFASSLFKVYKSKPTNTTVLSDKENPTVTICIAARNETPNLTSCLESIVNDEYPKLEVLVLDDESQDNTAEIIKSFANQGVRFVRQGKLDGEWLAKNNAYQTLLNNASGEVVLFMGVDVRLHNNSIKGLVSEFISRDVAMMTIIPKRTKSGLLAAFVQPMRYWWELALPSFVLKRKPALSTSWMAYKKSLDNIGGFKTYKRSITPEEHLARLYEANGGYSYIRTNHNCLVTTHKDFMRQWDTAVRTRYPHAHRRPETVLLQSFVLIFLIILPFALLPLALFGYIDSPYNFVIYTSIFMYLTSHIVISIITNPVAGYLAPFNFPIAIALDIVALHVSMYNYEFKRVIWKGRDVAPKKLTVIKKLPKV